MRFARATVNAFALPADEAEAIVLDGATPGFGPPPSTRAIGATRMALQADEAGDAQVCELERSLVDQAIPPDRKVPWAAWRRIVRSNRQLIG